MSNSLLIESVLVSFLFFFNSTMDRSFPQGAARIELVTGNGCRLIKAAKRPCNLIVSMWSVLQRHMSVSGSWQFDYRGETADASNVNIQKKT